MPESTAELELSNEELRTLDDGTLIALIEKYEKTHLDFVQRCMDVFRRGRQIALQSHREAVTVLTARLPLR